MQHIKSVSLGKESSTAWLILACQHPGRTEIYFTRNFGVHPRKYEFCASRYSRPQPPYSCRGPIPPPSPAHVVHPRGRHCHFVSPLAKQLTPLTRFPPKYLQITCLPCRRLLGGHTSFSLEVPPAQRAGPEWRWGWSTSCNNVSSVACVPVPPTRDSTRRLMVYTTLLLEDLLPHSRATTVSR